MYVLGVSFFRASPIVFQVKPSKPCVNVTSIHETIHDNLQHGSYDILSNSPPAFPSDKICPDGQPQAPYFDAFHTFFTVAVRNSQDHPMVYIPPKRSVIYHRSSASLIS